MGLESGPNLEQRTFAELEHSRAALVLDNAETPWESDPLATEGLLAQLAAIRGLCLVVSVRGQQRPQGVAWREPVVIPPLDLPAARQAFVAVAGQRFCSDPRLDDLVNVVDRVPLAITLLAYQAEGQPNLDGLWGRWQTERTKMLQRAGGADRLTNLELSLELSISGPRMNDVARALLSLLGLLPDGIAWQDLDYLLPGQGAVAAADLRRVGLALDDDKNARLRVLAPVREFVHHHLVPGEADMNRAVDHYLSLAEVLGNQVGFEGGAEAATRLAPEINNLESMILIALNRPELDRSVRSARAPAEFIRLTGLGTPLVLEKARDAARSRNDADAEAKCAESLGNIALARSDHDQARERYEAALPLYRRVGSVVGEANCIQSLGGIALRVRTTTRPANAMRTLCRSTDASVTSWARPTASVVWATSRSRVRTTTRPANATRPHCHSTDASVMSWARPTASRAWVTSRCDARTTTRPANATRTLCHSSDASVCPGRGRLRQEPR